MKTPAELYKDGMSEETINACFAETFVPVKGLKFVDNRPVLYTGGSVLRNFYQDPQWESSDVDIFVPVYSAHPYRRDTLNWRDMVAQTYSYDPSLLTAVQVCGTYSAVFSFAVVKLQEVGGRNIDLVFLNVGCIPEFMTKEGFHELIYEEFDIKICTMSWDGAKLYYPLIPEENIIEKKTPVVRNVLDKRRKKYEARGFTLYSM